MFNVSSFPVIDLTRYSKRLLVLPNIVWERPSGAFFSLRCLIYKVHAVSGGTFAMLTSFISLVKYFFQSFLTFVIQLLSAATLLSYHTFRSLSSTFLNFFKIFSFRTPPRHRSADSLVRIPRRNPFVNSFFQIFSSFLMRDISRTNIFSRRFFTANIVCFSPFRTYYI